MAHKACREGYTVQYIRLSQLLRELMIAKGDGRYPKLLANLAKVDVLLLDDWGLIKLSAENRRDLLEVLEDRHGIRSTIDTCNYRWTNGTTSSATRPWLTLSWIAWFTMLTRST